MKSDTALNSHAQWFQVRVAITAEIEDAVIGFLFDLGSKGCQQFEHSVTAFFPAEENHLEISQRLNSFYSEVRALGFIVPPPNIEIYPVDELDWTSIWKRHFKPIFVHDKLVIKPSWESLPSTSAAVIEIDPKQAFGTGNHATTLMALEFLAETVEDGQTILDVGTGTGILAMAAVKLGASRAVAVDIDPVAIDAARENSDKNGTVKKIDFMIGETMVLQPIRPFDVIVANINRLELVKLIPEFQRLLANDGRIFVTGILVDETDLMMTEFSKHSKLAIQKKVTKDEWLGLLLKAEKNG